MFSVAHEVWARCEALSELPKQLSGSHGQKLKKRDREAARVLAILKKKQGNEMFSFVKQQWFALDGLFKIADKKFVTGG